MIKRYLISLGILAILPISAVLFMGSGGWLHWVHLISIGILIALFCALCVGVAIFSILIAFHILARRWIR